MKLKDKFCSDEGINSVEFEWDTYKHHGIKEDDILAEI